MFNKKNCEMKGKKVIHQGGPGGIVQIASWKCNFGIYLDIQAIMTLLCLLLVLYVLVSSIYSFFYLTTALLKSDIFWHSKSFAATVFNLQASDWVHCEEETGAYYQLYRHTYKLVILFNKFLTFLILPQKNMRISKNSLKFIIHFFFTKRYWAYVYMY